MCVCVCVYVCGVCVDRIAGVILAVVFIKLYSFTEWEGLLYIGTHIHTYVHTYTYHNIHTHTANKGEITHTLHNQKLRHQMHTPHTYHEYNKKGRIDTHTYGINKS